MTWILHTERLSLREFSINDADQFYELNLDPQVIQYTGDRPFSSLSGAQQFLRAYPEYREHGIGRWAVIEKTNGVFLGWCGLKKLTYEKDTVDIGFRFHRRFWNQGFATEAAKACVIYGFEEKKVSNIIGRAWNENKASIRVLEKIGLTYEKAFKYEGRDAVLYTLSQRDWYKKRATHWQP